MQRVLRVITLQGEIEKSPILLSQYWKFEWFVSTIIISYLCVSIRRLYLQVISSSQKGRHLTISFLSPTQIMCNKKPTVFWFIFRQSLMLYPELCPRVTLHLILPPSQGYTSVTLPYNAIAFLFFHFALYFCIAARPFSAKALHWQKFIYLKLLSLHLNGDFICKDVQIHLF
jgi:hypothetical protein